MYLLSNRHPTFWLSALLQFSHHTIILHYQARTSYQTDVQSVWLRALLQFSHHNKTTPPSKHLLSNKHPTCLIESTFTIFTSQSTYTTKQAPLIKQTPNLFDWEHFYNFHITINLHHQASTSYQSDTQSVWFRALLHISSHNKTTLTSKHLLSIRHPTCLIESTFTIFTSHNKTTPPSKHL